ncbi:hypothetical protein ESA_pESA3p05515 (plasmid) [Cronobacter sakazakii ATCC BAA-894]|uniref:Uncharacterized protein n=1 Tax=Cronobacter sakazakii (strain ATCC BAA-894) TaxID=290339 RepID=A7MRN8_CROS8|nr:hypothetical protein ESA_pESA3p05515 [Cronobacter sakazakii ATCC BAA-894]
MRQAVALRIAYRQLCFRRVLVSDVVKLDRNIITHRAFLMVVFMPAGTGRYE